MPSLFGAILNALSGVSESSYDLGLPHGVGGFDQSFKDRMGEFIQLPAAVGEDDVVASAEAASSAEGQRLMLQRYAQNMQRIVRSEVGIYGTRAQYAQAMMQADQTVQKIDLKHMKARSVHNLEMRSNQAEARGWQHQFQQTRSGIRL
jgi:hypothetical protein